jgi:hypothetical protein
MPTKQLQIISAESGVTDYLIRYSVFAQHFRKKCGYNGAIHQPFIK